MMARIDREIALLILIFILLFVFKSPIGTNQKKTEKKRKEKTLDGLIKEGGSSCSFRFGKTSLMYNLK